jgi:hypothetical protein
MRPRETVTPRSSRGRFPRPNLTMRELIGLVVAFAVSNAFLSWIDPTAASNVGVFAVWNGLLAFYLGFAFVQAWLRSVIRWIRTGDASPVGGGSPRWTALGVAEATVVGGTMFCCVGLMFEKLGRSGMDGNDWAVVTTILLIGTAGAILIRRMWRRDREKSLTGRLP